MNAEEEDTRLFYNTQVVSDRSVWLPVTGVGKTIFPLNSSQCVRVSLLGSLTSELATLTTPQYGYFMADIDSEDLTLAISSAQEFVGKIKALKVKSGDFQIELSGKKGVHVYIKPECFGFQSLVPGLYAVYKHIAEALSVPGLDLQVYSGKQGRMVRPTNSERDKGVYKVIVTEEELASLTPEGYRELVKSPRDLPSISGRGVLAAGLKPLARKAERAVQLLAAKEEDAPVTAEGSVDIGTVVPDCIRKAMTGSAVKDITFHAVEYPVALFLKASQLGQNEKNQIIKSVCSAWPSTSGDKSQRPESLRQSVSNVQVEYFTGRVFCGSMKNYLAAKPACSSCSVFNKKEDVVSEGVIVNLADEPENYVPVDKSFEAIEKEYGLTMTDTGFAQRFGTKKYSNFSMEIFGVYTQTDELTDDSIAGYSIKCKLPSRGLLVNLGFVPLSAFLSKKEFVKVMLQVEGSSYYGTEADLPRILNYMTCMYNFKNGAKPRIKPTLTSGIRVTELPVANGGVTKVVTWVQKHYAVNNFGQESTFELKPGHPHTYLPCIIKPCDPLALRTAFEAFTRLWGINDPMTMSVLIAFMLYTQISQQLTMSADTSLVSLHINAESGSGKSAALKKLLTLCGYTAEAGQALSSSGSIGSGTSIASLRYLVSSSSMPVVINEMNKKSMDEKAYTSILELVKACYDRSSITKCRVSTPGDESPIQQTYIRTPLILVGEEPLHATSTGFAVINRIVRLTMTKDHAMSRSAAFHALSVEYPDVCTELGRSLIRYSIDTRPEALGRIWVDAVAQIERLSEQMELKNTQHRQVQGFAKLLTAVKWGQEAFTKLNAPIEAHQILRDVEIGLYKMWEGSATRADTASSSLADSLASLLDALAYNKSIGTQDVIRKGADYTITPDGRLLVIDLNSVYPYFAAYMRIQGRVDPFRNSEVMKAAFSESPYGSTEVPYGSTLIGRRSLLVINLERASEDGINTRI